MPALTQHQLALEVPEQSCSDRLTIWDASVYANGITVDCEKLEIKIPGYSTVYTHLYTDSPNPLEYNFNNTYTAIDFGIQAQGSAELACLPDGLYTIQYSVSPNDEVYVKYYHLRTTKALNEYYKEICKIQLAQCEPTAEMKQHLSDLRYIKMLIDAAKAKVEFCHSTEQGVAMLQYANKLMKKYQDGCCITCA